MLWIQEHVVILFTAVKGGIIGVCVGVLCTAKSLVGVATAAAACTSCAQDACYQ